jgi:pyruvate carboxylase
MAIFVRPPRGGVVVVVAALLAAAAAAATTGSAFLHPIAPTTMRGGGGASSSSTTTTTSLRVSPSVATTPPPPVADDGDDDVAAPATTRVRGGGLPPPPFRKIMAANRAEISVRIQRAATELNVASVAVYADEDRLGQHRWGADESYLLERGAGSTPISAYLDAGQIISIARRAGVDAIHPGYGFLSESPEFARACGDAGIAFVGPTVANLETFSDKTSARAAAIEAGVPVVPGSGALADAAGVVSFVESIGLPIIIKASMGGGGKGMRVVRRMSDLVPSFESASSEALASFGDGSVFVERYLDRPRHIEVQIIGDGNGNVIHLWERDCSVQRRHQKVIEMAPAWSLPDELRAELHRYAVELTGRAKYKNAGTVEFLIDDRNRPYFIEVNPRIQVRREAAGEGGGVK